LFDQKRICNRNGVISSLFLFHDFQNCFGRLSRRLRISCSIPVCSFLLSRFLSPDSFVEVCWLRRESLLGLPCIAVVGFAVLRRSVLAVNEKIVKFTSPFVRNLSFAGSFLQHGIRTLPGLRIRNPTHRRSMPRKLTSMHPSQAEKGRHLKPTLPLHKRLANTTRTRLTMRDISCFMARHTRRREMQMKNVWERLEESGHDDDSMDFTRDHIYGGRRSKEEIRLEAIARFVHIGFSKIETTDK